MEQVRKLATKNIYFLIAYSAIAVAGVWVYEKVIRPRKVQREIKKVVSELNEMRDERTKHIASLFTGTKDSISKL
jgi:p-aminobenzoyl-glutamate transporter AbgT